jgi:hypothetical protein
MHSIVLQPACGWFGKGSDGATFLRKGHIVWIDVVPTKRSPSILEFLFGGKSAWVIG